MLIDDYDLNIDLRNLMDSIQMLTIKDFRKDKVKLSEALDLIERRYDRIKQYLVDTYLVD